MVFLFALLNVSSYNLHIIILYYIYFYHSSLASMVFLFVLLNVSLYYSHSTMLYYINYIIFTSATARSRIF
ncbi:hypothetical protein T492DRAFT_1013064, partial [Pavlovales sp. CCMP2436]